MASVSPPSHSGNHHGSILLREGTWLPQLDVNVGPRWTPDQALNLAVLQHPPDTKLHHGTRALQVTCIGSYIQMMHRIGEAFQWSDD